MTFSIVIMVGRGYFLPTHVHEASLFLAMHTNSILVQPEFKDGVLNPKYVGGIRRFLCGILHDLNPCGQAAQLSTWEVWNPVRIVVLDLTMIAGMSALGCGLFRRKNIN